MKRYAIVPLDKYNCPKYYYEWFKCKHCGNCAKLWGDTKEQLIAKVQTAIERLKNDKSRIVVGNDMWAKFIVEFLGVEE